MRLGFKRVFAGLLALPLMAAGVSFSYVEDDDIPEITDRVARISYVEGDVRIKRADVDEWEEAVLNLPIVEGDEIVAGADSRFELQFGSHKFARIGENAALRIVSLRDDGVAISLPEGSMIVTLKEFDPNTAFFEIDAPKSTISLQAAGRYRIDSFADSRAEVRVSADDGGEARIYSENSGFTLRSGRSARVHVGGEFAGEWKMADASLLRDALEDWAINRDRVVASRLATAHYDEYYDRDIYGADELNDYGQWVHTSNYGYIWRPYGSSISRYSNWSPYRYGHWRWIPPFGWTWVNDEPWGWATYHYGRWIWYNGFWHWSPYSYYRHGRSWWRPALVYMTVWNNRICWYPLSYYYAYYPYNYHYYAYNPRRPRHNWPRANPTPTPAPQPAPGQPANNEERRLRNQTPPLSNVPPNAVVAVSKEEFGRTRANHQTPPLANARQIVSKVPDVTQTPPIMLPTGPDVIARPGSDVRAQRPPLSTLDATVKTGATVRTPDAPLDPKLRETRIYGNRPPLQTPPVVGGAGQTPRAEPQRPSTGAVERPVVPRPAPRTEPGQTPPIWQPQEQQRRSEPPATTPAPRQEAPRQTPPATQPQQRTEQPRGGTTPPLRQQQPNREAPRPSAPSQPAPSRPSPPPARSEPSRPSSPPARSEPSRPSSPPARSEPSRPSPPPARSEPSRPSSPPAESKGKDGE